MRFLVDEGTGPAVAHSLAEQGYHVFSVYDNARGAEDDWIIQKAFEDEWILVTNDKDFGEKVYRERRPPSGVVLLRIEDERAANKIVTMRRLIENHGGQLAGRYVVVTESQVRFARRQSW